MQKFSAPVSDLWQGDWAFEDRDDAGRRLARLLSDLSLDDPVVLGLPRGGVPVAARVALDLHAPLDVIIVRKLGLPSAPEVAMGAIGEGGVRVMDEGLIEAMGVTTAQWEAVEAREREILRVRSGRLRQGRGRLDLAGRTALIVDDGIATGATATAACVVARALGAPRVVVAAPVGPPDAADRVRGADAVVCLIQPGRFHSVGGYYRRFEPTSDDEVATILSVARPPATAR